MDELIKKITKLIDVKSIVTLLMAYGFLYLTLHEVIDAEQFVNIFQMIIAFYFGTQYEKNKA